MIYDPPVLYELHIAGRDGNLMVHALHDPAKGKVVASYLKQTIRAIQSEENVAISGMIYRFTGAEPEGEPVLLMHFTDSGNYCELCPIDPINVDAVESHYWKSHG